MEPAHQWGDAFTVMIGCASKLGTRLPYMGMFARQIIPSLTVLTLRLSEHSLRALCRVATSVDCMGQGSGNPSGPNGPL